MTDVPLHRNQFALGPDFATRFPGWQRVEAGRAGRLTVHPSLAVTQANSSGRALTLLGFALHSEKPDLSDYEVLRTLLGTFTDWTALMAGLGPLGGRWCVIAEMDGEVRLFTDAAGLRQVMYAPVEGTVWCASQAHVLAEALGFAFDPEALSFAASPAILDAPDYWWPGDRTPYSGIRRLLPNHFLDLKTGECRRFWPVEALSPLPLEVVVPRASRRLSQLVQAAARRFELSLSLTAGWDSRLVLAASREVADRIQSTTVQLIGMRPDNRDLQIAARLARAGGLSHTIVPVGENLRPGFRAAYWQSATAAHAHWAPDAQALFDHYQLSRVAMTGSASEIARCFYHSDPVPAASVTPESLCDLIGMSHHPFARKALAVWWADCPRLPGYHPLDLLYWEQRAGSWLAMCQAEFDCAWRDIFTPYNCRSLLIEMLAAPESSRRAPGYALYFQMICALWPEMVQEPINPPVRSSLPQQIRQQAASWRQLLRAQFDRSGEK